MGVLEAGFKALFLLTSVTSAVGFGYAKKLHASNGPSKRIANFSIFMGYSFGFYLMACLGTSFYCAAAGETVLTSLLLLFLSLPFALAFSARSYDRAKTVFDVQILGLVLGAVSLISLDRDVRHLLLRLG